MIGHRKCRKADKSSVDKAQEMLSHSRRTANTWILLSKHGVYTIIIDQLFLLYSLISQSSLCVIPFTDCLKYIMEVGDELVVHEQIIMRRSSGSLTEYPITANLLNATFVTSDKLTAVVSWTENDDRDT